MGGKYHLICSCAVIVLQLQGEGDSLECRLSTPWQEHMQHILKGENHVNVTNSQTKKNPWEGLIMAMVQQKRGRHQRDYCLLEFYRSRHNGLEIAVKPIISIELT